MMGRLYSTKRRINGPWLLDEKALLELDKIISEQWEKVEGKRIELLQIQLEKRRQEELKARVQDTPEEKKKFKKKLDEYLAEYSKQSQYSQSKKLVEVYFSDNSRIVRTGLEELKSERSIIDCVPVGLNFSLNSAIGSIENSDFNCSLSIDENYLEIDVKPEELKEAQETYVRLLKWAENQQSPVWKIWNTLGRLTNPFYIGILIFLVIIVAAIRYTYSIYQNISNIIPKIQQLLSDGVTQNNMSEAIGVLLALVAAFFPNTATTTILSWLTSRYLVFGILIIAISQVHPKTVLGIGKGSQHIRLWNIWQYIVVAIVVLPIIQEIISRFVIHP